MSRVASTSTARRATCLTLALVSFLAVAWKGYWLGSEVVYRTAWDWPAQFGFEVCISYFWVLLAPALLLAPLFFASIAYFPVLHVVPRSARDARLIFLAIGWTGATAYCFWQGRQDALAVWRAWPGITPPWGRWIDMTAMLLPSHKISPWPLFSTAALSSLWLLVTAGAMAFRGSVRNRHRAQALLGAAAVASLITSAILICDRSSATALGLTFFARPPFPFENAFGTTGWWILFGACFAAIPACLLSLARNGSPVRLSDSWVASSAVLCTTALGLASHVGREAWKSFMHGRRGAPFNPEYEAAFPWIALIAVLLLPTTILVIGSWRALRDPQQHEAELATGEEVDEEAENEDEETPNHLRPRAAH